MHRKGSSSPARRAFKANHNVVAAIARKGRPDCKLSCTDDLVRTALLDRPIQHLNHATTHVVCLLHLSPSSGRP